MEYLPVLLYFLQLYSTTQVQCLTLATPTAEWLVTSILTQSGSDKPRFTRILVAWKAVVAARGAFKRFKR